ncbi:hypothetical protein A7K93_02190 [Candidatus Methylacidiphilum fumarolicum]|nr:hypothetical protein [Candidatus Methylacidiphilum fumarolicum]TFE68346.1 hypothetical protein A7K73_01015 [Candidatus Methylacidiphilum fumarolicum]TFE73569.1 hypothetical protein A7K72_06655 [Candidatus Methylacidiphilum fumarolicum]TFE74970.1 hypothetical protein A7K93_02190 [Candidatus Methylacidiphilum fumarolicum]TFE76511.1 hypothetical protein A7D33_09195 [Candidatus Methylacidiphilum fumarolicum]
MKDFVPFLFFLLLVALQVFYGLRRGRKSKTSSSRVPFPWEKEKQPPEEKHSTSMATKEESIKESIPLPLEKELPVIFPAKEITSLKEAPLPKEILGKKEDWDIFSYEEKKPMEKGISKKELVALLKETSNLRKVVILAEIIGPPLSISSREKGMFGDNDL